MRIWVFIVMLAMILGVSCAQEPGIDQTPFWSKKDLEKSCERVSSISPVAYKRKTIIYIRPPFYKGSMPLGLIEICARAPGFMGSSPVVLIQDFGDWRNLFIYPDQMAVYHSQPAGALSVDNNTNKLVAECKVRQMLTKEKQLSGHEIEEIHYANNGKVIFRGRFQVSYGMNFKVNEISGSGRKNKEYYFLWPSCIGL